MGTKPLGETPLYGGDCRQMKAAADSFDGVADDVSVRHIGTLTRGEIIQDTHRGAACQKRLAQMRTNESRAASDQVHQT